MKKILTICSVILFSISAFAGGGDMLLLNNHQLFMGDVLKIKDCSLIFKAENGRKYKIPAQDIAMVQFADAANEVYSGFLQSADENPCMKGSMDAKAFHGKTGSHVALGVLFGAFAVIGAAVSNPDPMTGARTMEMSKNRELFEDPQYLECYKKAARSSNATAAGGGWVMSILLLLTLF